MIVEINGIKVKVRQIDITLADKKIQNIYDKSGLLFDSFREIGGKFMSSEAVDIEKSGLKLQKYKFVSTKV